MSYGSQSNSSNMSLNPRIEQSRNLRSSSNNTNHVSSLNGIDPLKHSVFIDNSALKNEIDLLKVELTRGQTENLVLKK